MDPPHPIVALIEKEHNYARPWYKKLNASQRYPSRVTRFLYLRNFPRHFLTKYPFAFSSAFDGNIDVGSAEDLHNQVRLHVDYKHLKLELDDQEKDSKISDDGEKVEEPVLDTSMWTQQMDRLYYKVLQILQQYYLTKLLYENSPNRPIRLVNLLENTSLQLRHSFANIAGWDNELLTWLHNLFITKIPSHDHLIDVYHEVMQYLSQRLPLLIEKFYSVEKVPSLIATTPPRSTPRRLPSNPLILIVPSGPSIPSQPGSARMEYWNILLSSMGQLTNINIPYRPEQNAFEILQVIKASVRDKIRDLKKKKFSRPLILVGFNQGALIAIHCALENPGLVSSVVCIGFPLSAINGFRGDLDDPMLDMNIPILFVVGQMSSTATLDALERLRESMTRSDTGLVVVGGANDKLIVNYRKKMFECVTQHHVDKSIADEVYEFINSINLQHSDVYS